MTVNLIKKSWVLRSRNIQWKQTDHLSWGGTKPLLGCGHSFWFRKQSLSGMDPFCDHYSKKVTELNWIEVKNVKFHWNTWKTWTVVWDCHVFFLLLTWQSWAGSILRHYSWRAAVNETEETLTFDFRWHLALSFGLLEDISKCQGLSGVAYIIPFISTNKI